MCQPQVKYVSPINTMFGVSKAPYLILPRSVLALMPNEWQEKFADLIHELVEGMYWDIPENNCSYKISLINKDGILLEETEDIFSDYSKPIPMKDKKIKKKIIKKAEEKEAQLEMQSAKEIEQPIKQKRKTFGRRILEIFKLK